MLYVTGNQHKADYLARYLGFTIEHEKLDLDEIQSLDLHQIAEHKARQAYDIVKKPVLVEDVALEIRALGKLPGPFIKFFVQEVPFETICRMVDGMDRSATARCVFCYFDGSKLHFFEGSLAGSIAQHPSGKGGFGFDQFFIPSGFEVTRAQLSQADDQATYTQIKPFAKVKAFLEQKR